MRKDNEYKEKASKRLRYILVAENPAYAPMVFTESSQKNVYILGKAIAFQSNIK